MRGYNVMRYIFAFVIMLFICIIISPTLYATTITKYNDVQQRIPGGSGTWGYMSPDSTISFTEEGIVDTLSVYLNIYHSSHYDITARLWDQDYTSSALLFNYPLGSGNLIRNINLTEWARGKELLGDWHLRIYDRMMYDTGLLRNWSITTDFTPHQSSTVVPEPTTWLLLGTGLFALFGLCRKKFLTK